MSKHTPGPWEWIGPNQLWGGERGNDEVLKAADDGKAYGMHSALIEHHWDGEQAKANAHLIAAAPDLLAVARMVVENYEGSDGDEQSVVRAARAAIAKATGGEA